jgi:hypothetical protein
MQILLLFTDQIENLAGPDVPLVNAVTHAPFFFGRHVHDIFSQALGDLLDLLTIAYQFLFKGG